MGAPALCSLAMARGPRPPVALLLAAVLLARGALSAPPKTARAKQPSSKQNVKQPNRTMEKAVYGTLRKGERYGEPCNLKVCTQWAHGRLYVLETYDGVGHRVANLLNGLALAHKHQMGFGGVIRAPNTRQVSDHGVNFSHVLDGLFGPGAADELMFRTDTFMTRDTTYLDMKLHQPFAIKFRTEQDFEKRFAEIDAEDHIYVPIVALHTSKSLVGYFPEDLQTLLGERLATRSLSFAPGKTSVAIHVRRGDLPKGDERATTDAYYFRLLDAILEEVQDADVHLWSSTTGTHRHEAPLWKSEDFDAYRSRGITVHLNDESMLDPWAHMSRADILVTSLSYFSYTPAVLSRGCVVYPGFAVYQGHRAEVPSNWINALDIEGLEAKSDYVPYEAPEGEHAMYMHPAEMEHHRRMKAKAEANGDVKVEFDSSSDASVFQRGLRECLQRRQGRSA